MTTSQMEVVFQRKEAIEETYMVFGGLSMDRPDALSKITFVGLSMADAQPIYSRYPDFNECKSPGAAAAQSLTRQMDIVPSNGDVLASLQEVLAQHAASLRSGGERVCVRLSGSVLTIASATAQAMDITSQLPPELKHDYYFVQRAEIVDVQRALEL